MSTDEQPSDEQPSDEPSSDEPSSDEQSIVAGNDTENEDCAFCRRSITFMCTACGSSAYCSAECKDADWPSHRVLCREFVSHLAVAPSDDDDATPVVCFPPEASNPFFAWRTTAQLAQTPFEWRLESSSDAVVCTTVEGTNPIRQRPYRRPILLLHAAHHLQRGIRNPSVDSIIGSARRSQWRGWVTAIIPSPVGGGIDMRDVRELADFFTSYQLDDFQLGLLREGVEKNTGVCLNSPTDVWNHDGLLLPFPIVQVPKAHPIYLEPVCEISVLIGLPIHTFKYVYELDSYSAGNPTAAHLHRCCDVDSPVWGFPPQEWLATLGSVLVVRSDGKAFLSAHAEALCHFCYLGFGDVFSLEAEDQAYQSGSQEQRRKLFTARASREGFETFFEWYRSNKVSESAEWRHVPSPYEM